MAPARNRDRNDVVRGADTKRFARRPSLKWCVCVCVGVTLDGLGDAAELCNKAHVSAAESGNCVDANVVNNLLFSPAGGGFAPHRHTLVLKIPEKEIPHCYCQVQVMALV